MLRKGLVFRKGCFRLLVALLFLLLAGGVLLYRFLGSQVNLAGIVATGGEAAVAVPDGFSAAVYAEGLQGPRFMALGPDGMIYVAERGAGNIVRLVDADGDGRAEGTEVFAAELDNPHSLVYHEGAWYVGVPTGVVRLQDADGDGVAELREAVVDDIPGDGNHRTRTVLFLPDGRMVLSVGSTCNVCVEEDPRRAAVLVYDGPDGANGRILASGLRNAVGLALRPETGELWATNNGRDFMGDDLPPENVYVVRDGADYGWPACHSGDIVDPEFGEPGACEDVEQPVVAMQAHSAPLGLTFYDGEMFPPEYRGDLFIAFHGSWNRSVPTGYKVVRLPFEDGEPADEVVDFATGWLDVERNAVDGRPVDVLVGADGALYVSDDKGGFIYRISYEEG
ncbi:MAG: sorbosone dehydrogenase family protein [Anaerolineae bacterium]|nr:sorbosone dehydrogenase family protein [Anaerolineae bacterium]